jgi:hypothetical protein
MTEADRARRRELSEGGGTYIRSDTMSEKERKLIYESTGIHFEKRSDLEREMRKRGKRFLDKGEPGDLMRRAVREWSDSGGEACGVPAPRIEDFSAPPPPRRHLDMGALFRENMERAKAKYRDSDA